MGKEHTLGLGRWGKGAALGWMGMGPWAALWMPPALCGMDGPREPPVQRGEMSASGSLGGPRPLEETLDISSTLIVRIDLRLKADEATALLTAGGLRTHAQRPQLLSCARQTSKHLSTSWGAGGTFLFIFSLKGPSALRGCAGIRPGLQGTPPLVESEGRVPAL